MESILRFERLTQRAHMLGAAIAFLLASAIPALGQPTGFTYQGQLKNGGSPASGAFDMSFSIFDADVDGNLVAGPLVFDGQGGNPPQLNVTSGLFTVTLDFGGGIFDGSPRWLEITVSGSTLTPRQSITSAPYSQRAIDAQSCSIASYANAPWVPSGADLYYADGNVGIGINSPATALDVIGTVKMDSLLLPTGAAAGKVLTSDAAGNGLSVQIDSTLDNAQAIAGTISQTAPGNFSTGVRGHNSATNARGMGVWGSHGGGGDGVRGTSVSGNGVYGIAASNGFGVYGTAPINAVYGYSSGTSGIVYGTLGFSNSNDGGGVHGWAYSSSGTTKGVTGLNYSSQGVGVLGSAEAASGTTSGVLGQSSSANGNGVKGIVFNGTGNAGVYGVSTALNGNGIIAEATNGPSAYGLWAKASQGTGVRCDGALTVSGTKSFRIDHPLDPENKYLVHYCSESPEPLNTYTGNVTTDLTGYATVALPNYFEEINRDFRYQLTVVDSSDDFVLAKVVRGVSRNTFQIRTSKPGVDVSWMVLATRNDAYVRRYGAPVETEKPAAERGRYIDPGLYGQPPEKGQSYHSNSEHMTKMNANSAEIANPVQRAFPETESSTSQDAGASYEKGQR